MNIHGFQKLTLLDYPGKVGATVFTAHCNLRCPFCHNSFLVTDIHNEDRFSEEEILEALSKKAKILDGVCITGGEPLITEDTIDFMLKIKSLGLLVKLDTNGTFPERLKKAVEIGACDYVAMDIKNSKEKYAQTVGIENLDIGGIEKSVSYLLEGHVEYEFRTTVVKEFHTMEDIEKICEWIKGAKSYFLQNFVDSGNLIGENMHSHDKKELEKMAETARKYVQSVGIRGV
jgi:pyruvate formate lyase activating enzyme